MLRRTPAPHTRLVMLCFAFLCGCSSPSAEADVSAAPDLSTKDMSGVDAVVADQAASDVARTDAAVIDGPLDPTSYCEATVDVFCPYYLRCGRIAAADLADCERNFIETCNEAFEPQYAALAERGLLTLSAEGIAACRAHLETVECARQVFDLDGPCSGVWRGQGAAGAACAPGIGSFVCTDGTECVLTLSLCGTCEPAGAIGEPCIDNRCVSGGRCENGQCLARGLPGDACDDTQICVTGTSCQQGRCAGPTIVAVNEPCDGARRCPYQSTCRGSVCVQDALLGENCSAASCGSGWCDGTVCRAFVTPGDLCGEAFQCLSGRCESGACGEPVAGCFEG